MARDYNITSCIRNTDPAAAAAEHDRRMTICDRSPVAATTTRRNVPAVSIIICVRNDVRIVYMCMCIARIILLLKSLSLSIIIRLRRRPSNRIAPCKLFFYKRAQINCPAFI